MKNKISNAAIISSMVVFMICTVLFFLPLYSFFESETNKGLEQQTKILERVISSGDYNSKELIKSLENGKFHPYRLTLIDLSGKVLYDSLFSVESLDNHLTRPEVAKTLADGFAKSQRYSETYLRKMYYVATAVSLSDKDVILRLSIETHSIFSILLGSWQLILIVGLISTIVAIFFSSAVTKKLVQKLNRMNLDEPLSNEWYEELSPLLYRIHTQQKVIKNKEKELENKHLEFLTVIGNMSEGILLLGKKGEILIANRKAKILLDLSDQDIEKGENIILKTRNIEIKNLLEQAQGSITQPEPLETIVQLHSRHKIILSPVLEQTQDASGKPKISGYALLLLDIEEELKNEELRREFTANVSHELKTPLQTISGSAELLESGLVKDEDKHAFYQNIRSNAQHMIALVSDIITLSSLDEGKISTGFEKVSLDLLVEEVLGILRPEALKSKVALTHDISENTYIYGVRELARTIIYNLVENAIRYNREGGSVHLSIKTDHSNDRIKQSFSSISDSATPENPYGSNSDLIGITKTKEQGVEMIDEDIILLSVKDTGMGIPKEDQDRIFERFFRLERSRSKHLGGTGLGLSIVKHAVRLLRGSISLNSRVDYGTEFIVVFRKK